MTREYRITAAEFNQDTSEDCVLSTDDSIKQLSVLQQLAGLRNTRNLTELAGSNISVTAAEKSKIQKEKNIQPGTPEWFQLWFSLPYLTGEKPVGGKS